jgi:uncharacterized protein
MLINAFEFAKQSLEIHDKIPLLCIPELQQSLSAAPSKDEFVAYSLKGERDASGRLGVRLNVSGKMLLTCQRCLEPLEYVLVTDCWFELVSGEQDIPEDDADDEKDYLVASNELDVEALVRDEILLVLPLAPKHQKGFCISPLDLGGDGKDNPFKVLQAFKDGKSK